MCQADVHLRKNVLTKYGYFKLYGSWEMGAYHKTFDIKLMPLEPRRKVYLCPIVHDIHCRGDKNHFYIHTHNCRFNFIFQVIKTCTGSNNKNSSQNFLCYWNYQVVYQDINALSHI